MIVPIMPLEAAMDMPPVQPVGDFIDSYADYADVLEAPRSMHEVVAIQIIASILNKNGVGFQHGHRIPLDLWTLLVSGSGGGRSTVVATPQPLLEASGMGDLIKNTRWGSPEGLYQDFAQNPSAFFRWGEFSEKMKMLSDPRFAGAKEWLTDRYDNLQIPETIIYRRTARSNQNTPPINFIDAPRTTILATSSFAWFFSHLTQEDSAGGFIPRWAIVAANGPTKDVAVPREPDASLVEPLASALRRINELRGDADLSQIRSLYEEWYSPAKARFVKQPHSTLADAYFNRHRIHVIKFAVIFEVSRSGSLTVTPESWDRAVAFAAAIEKTIFSMLGTGMSAEGYAMAQLEEKVRKTGIDGLTKSQFTRAFQHWKPSDRLSRLMSFLDAGIIRDFSAPSGGGRTPTILVHTDFAKKYKELHPDHK